MRVWKTVFHSLSLSLLATVAWAGGGSGTADDPYIVSDVYELQAMRDDLSAHYALSKDIDASETALWNGGRGFAPVGSAADPFTGELDGRGHSISFLHIDRIGGYAQGLFGEAYGALIHDVHLRDANVSANSNSGTLVGRAYWETLIAFSSATGTLTLLPGSADAKSGGLVGAAGRGARVDQCYSGVEVVASSRRQVGSLVGYLRGVEPGPIASITNSYASGTVHGNGWKQGNLLGDADDGRVDRCYSSGLGKALIGFNFRTPVITNSYWDAERGAPSSRYGGVGKTTAQMMRRETFAGWDFDEVWGIDEQASYPYLRFDTPYEMARFDVGVMQLAFLGPGRDSLAFRALFTLADDSDGIEPALEEVTLRAGTYAETLPAGAFSCRRGRCSYRGPEGGIVSMVIGHDFVLATVRGTDLSGTTIPAELVLRIGNDRGDAIARLSGALSAPAESQRSSRAAPPRR